MAIQIKHAVKYDSKLRMALAGPSGSGKTYTALTLATALVGAKGVIVIDTERGSASKYADLFTFDVIDLESFSPSLYIEAIKAAEQAGYGVLVIDSLSHAWNGIGGILEMVDSIGRRKYSGNNFAAWKDVTPVQNSLIDTITRSSLHIIFTLRSKQEYTLEKDEKTGKSTPRKVGMAPIQRDGVEYEVDVFGELDIDNTLIITKSRCSALSGAVIAKPDGNVADVLKEWLSGEMSPQASEKAATLSTSNHSTHPTQATLAASHAVEKALPEWTAERRVRVESLYTRSGHVAGVLDTPSFLVYTGRVLERAVTTIKKFTDDELTRIEYDLASREAQPVA